METVDKVVPQACQTLFYLVVEFVMFITAVYFMVKVIKILIFIKRYYFGQIYCRHCRKVLSLHTSEDVSGCFVTPKCPNCCRILSPTNVLCPHCFCPIQGYIEDLFSKTALDKRSVPVFGLPGRPIRQTHPWLQERRNLNLN